MKSILNKTIILSMLRLLWQQTGYRKMGSGTLTHNLTVRL